MMDSDEADEKYLDPYSGYGEIYVSDKGKEEEEEYASNKRARTENISRSAVIPFKVQTAVEWLFAAYDQQTIKLSPQTQQELERFLNQPDEYTRVNPRLVISDTIRNKTCAVYLKEVVSFKYLMLARVLKCTYAVQFSSTETSHPKSYAQVLTKPFVDSRHGHAQPFHCKEAVLAKLEQQGHDINEIKQRVKEYMKTLGPLAPYAVNSVDVFEAQEPFFRKLLIE